MKTITVDGKPHLCLFALKDISPGEEIMYNYGDSDWPWRCKNSPQETDPVPPASPTSSIHEICKHDLVSSVVPSLDKCAGCSGPYSPLKWTGIQCKLCSVFWHKSCFLKSQSMGLEPQLVFRDSRMSEESGLESEERSAPTTIWLSRTESDYRVSMVEDEPPGEPAPPPPPFLDHDDHDDEKYFADDERAEAEED